MADLTGNTPSKKIKLDKKEEFVLLTEDKKGRILDAITALNSKETGLSLLKLDFCDAEKPYCFSDSTVLVRRNPPKLYKFLSVFKDGKDVLMAYINSGYSDLQTAQEKISLEKLFTFLNNIEETSKMLRQPKYPIEKQIDWTLQLCHHVLKSLSRHEHYVVDDRTPLLGSVDLTMYGCPCCRQVLIGNTGDTSIGNTSVWHGRVDILMGPLAVIDASIAEADRDKPEMCASSPFKQNRLRELPRLISETIVFAFLQQKINKNLQSSLIPTISIANKMLLFQFYDPVSDILIDSELFSLMDENGQFLSTETVLALWLALNYELFCTGITQNMRDANFSADFTNFVKPEVLMIYKNQLTCGANMKPDMVALNLDEYTLESDEDE